MDYTKIGPRTDLIELSDSPAVRVWASLRRVERRRLITEERQVLKAMLVALQSREWSELLELLGEPACAVMVKINDVLVVREVDTERLFCWRAYRCEDGEIKAHDADRGESIADFLERTVGVEIYETLASQHAYERTEWMS